MAHPDHGAASWVRGIGGRYGLGQFESRLHVVNQRHAVTQCFTHQRLPIGLVAQHQDGVGVSVIDELGGKESVRQSLDGGCSRAGNQQMQLEFAGHHFI